jgi:ABC-type molybdate transport system substrate-binding protein
MSNSPKIWRRTQSGAAAEIQVLSAGAMGEIVRDLGDAYERTTGIKVRAEFSRSPLVRDRIRAGEPFDLVITTQSCRRAWRRNAAPSVRPHYRQRPAVRLFFGQGLVV